MRARNEIKLYAEMAFFNNMERYNRDYASQARRNTAKSSENVEQDQIVDNIEEVVETDAPAALKAAP